MGLFFLFRLLFLLIYPGSFASLGSTDIIIAFLDGIRFDLSIVLTFAGLPLFMLNVPVGRKWWIKWWSVVLIIGLYAAVILLTSDLIYFGYVRRHVGNELMLMFNDFGFLLNYIGLRHVSILVLVAAIAVYLGRIVFSVTDRKYDESRLPMLYESAKLGLILVMVVIGIRGTFGRKPINVIDAFGRGISAYGNLVLNGVFTAFHTSRHSQDVFRNYYPVNEAIDCTVDFFVEDDEAFTDMRYPLMRKRTDFLQNDQMNEKYKNIMVFFLESWSAEFIDGLSHNGYGVTPNFDSLAEQGFLFTRFYANGQRSIDGLASVFLSIPPVMGMPSLGRGLEIADIFRLGREAGAYGYTTIFVQSSRRRSFRMDAIADALGFDEYYGMEDIPLIYPYITDDVPSFGWDYDAVMFLEERLSDVKEPFMAFMFTGTTHEPYLLPDEKFQKFPHDGNGIDGFLNTLNYADWSIGELMKKASERAWFKDTIFIFTADHALGKFQADDIEGRFGIPLLIYSPSFIVPGVSETLGSQVDIVPTIIDLAGLDCQYSGLGKSLMREYTDRAAIIQEGSTLGIITNQGYLKHSRTGRLESSVSDGSGKDIMLDDMEKLLLSTDQAVYSLLNANRLYRSDRW